MKSRIKTCKTCCSTGKNKNIIYAKDVTSRKSGRVIKKWKSPCYQKHRLQSLNVHESQSEQYVFYSILNTDFDMDQGTAAAMIASGLIELYSELESDNIKVQYIDGWLSTGMKIIVLKGYDHKHLKYLKEEVKFVAIGTHTVYQSDGRGRIIVVLSVFGEKEDLAEIFEELSYLR